MRVILRPQIIIQNIDITYQSELKFLGICITENLKWGAHALLLRSKLCKVVYVMKTLKETISPYVIRNIYFPNSGSCLRYGIILWGGDNESNKIFKLQKKVLQIISGVNNRKSRRQIFKNCNILTWCSLYIIEMSFIKNIKI
jgi:hypothetical protein